MDSRARRGQVLIEVIFFTAVLLSFFMVSLKYADVTKRELKKYQQMETDYVDEAKKIFK